MTAVDGAVPAEVLAVLDDFQGMVSADGARLDLLSADDAGLVLDLVLVDAGCAECVMPREHLEGILRDQLKDALASPPAITIRDPRETA
jgi:hypothetical protein